MAVDVGVLGAEARRLNEAFNHWITHRTPFVIVKAAMSLDGKIATVTGESKWITGEASRRHGMKLRAGSDAVLVGVNTVVADDPSLTIRLPGFSGKAFRRIILDPAARIPPASKVLSGAPEGSTMVVVTKAAPVLRVAELERTAQVVVAPTKRGSIDLRWLLRKLGGENVTQLLVEGGGETHARFLSQGLAQRVVFFYAPLVLGGESAPKAVGGGGLPKTQARLALRDVEWRRLGREIMLTARL